MRDLNELRRLANAAIHVYSDTPAGIAFENAASPDVVLALLDRLERAEDEIKDLRSQIDCYETEAEDLRNETGVDDLEGQVMSSREENASLRGLLAEAGKALEPFARLGRALDEDCPRPKSGIVRFPLLDNRPFSEQHIDHLIAARTVATKIEEALK